VRTVKQTINLIETPIGKQITEHVYVALVNGRLKRLPRILRKG
jgi:hypothetical protein